jgi:hypothetical protein
MAWPVSVSGADATDGNICVHPRASAVEISLLIGKLAGTVWFLKRKKYQPRMHAGARGCDSDEETSRVKAKAESEIIRFSRYGPLTAGRRADTRPIHG